MDNKRYNRLITIIEKCLSESSKCVDTRLAVQECYGDDISMFAADSSSSGSSRSSTNIPTVNNHETKHNNDNDNSINDDQRNKAAIDMLSNLISDVLEKINDTFLQQKLPQILSKENIQLKLDSLDQILDQFQSEQKSIEQKEQQDIQSAKEAVTNTQFLTQGMTIDHIMTYHTYQMKLKMRDELLSNVKQAEKERDLLLQEMKKEKIGIDGIIDDVEKNVLDPLNRNADICSFSGIS